MSAPGVTPSPGRWAPLTETPAPDAPGPVGTRVLGHDLVVLRVGGALRAFEGRCPHQGALLGEGELDGDHLVCRNHRWRFDAGTGARPGGPECLRACPVELRDGAPWVDVSALDVALAPTRARRRWKDLPGPRARPFVGNALQLDPPKLHLVLEGWAREYGATYRLRLPGRRLIVTSEPALLDAVLRARPERFRRDGKLRPIFRELGVDGVFSAEGVDWRPQRKLAMEALAARHLRGFYPALRQVAERLRARWEAHAARGEPVDILDDLARFTVDVTTLLVFGHDLDTLRGGDDVIQRHLAHVFPTLTRRLTSVVPWWRLRRSRADRHADAAIAALRAWLAELIVAARARLAAEPARATQPANFLEAMLVARDDDGRPFSDEVLFGNLITMLVAGEDTTSTTLAWAVHELLEAPAERAALAAELAAALAGATVPPDLEACGRLVRAGAIAQETMRVRPVAPVLFLQANEATVVGDIELEPGMGVVALTRVPAVAPAHFHAPEVFRPERWLAEGPGAHTPSAHLPFGSGPRICPGRSLALLELKVVLATLYANFDVERVGRAADVQEHFSFTVAPTGLRVRLRARTASAAAGGA